MSAILRAKTLRIQQFILAIEIARRGNLARAAAALHLTQSAATKNLKALETIVGVRLFDRHGPGMVLTHYGQRFITHAEQILDHLERSMDELSGMADGNIGHVRVGTLIAASPVLLPRALKACAESRPGISVEVVEGMNDTLLPQLEAGRIDLIVGRTSFPAAKKHLLQTALYSDPIAVVVRRDHPLSRQDTINLSDLTRYSWILPPRETSLRGELEGEFERAGEDSPRVKIESIALSTNLSLLSQSDYIGVLPSQVLRAHEASFKLTSLPIALGGLKTRIGVTMTTKRDHSPATLAFVNILEQEALELQA